MSDEIRPTCEPNEPIAFLDWLEAQIAIEHEAVSPPPIHPNCRCHIDEFKSVTYAEFKILREHYRDTIIKTFGLPPSLIGKNPPYSSLEQLWAEIHFYLGY